MDEIENDNITTSTKQVSFEAQESSKRNKRKKNKNKKNEEITQSPTNNGPSDAPGN